MNSNVDGMRSYTDQTGLPVVLVSRASEPLFSRFFSAISPHCTAVRIGRLTQST